MHALLRNPRYGAEQGQGALREAVASTFYTGLRAADEIFISDGSKCDIARLQMMFGNTPTVAVQVGWWRWWCWGRAGYQSCFCCHD
jgi:aspartate/methionine/tyrosine aminotransferase